jgi:hypothetical protein
MYENLAVWAFSEFSDVLEEPTRISVPTTRRLWIDESVDIAHDDAFMPPAGGHVTPEHLEEAARSVVSIRFHAVKPNES